MMPAGSSPPDYFVCSTCGHLCCHEFRGGNSFGAQLRSDGYFATPMMHKGSLFVVDDCGHYFWMWDQQPLKKRQLHKAWLEHHKRLQTEWKTTDFEAIYAKNSTLPLPGASWLSEVKEPQELAQALAAGADQGDPLKREHLLCNVWWDLNWPDSELQFSKADILSELIPLFEINWSTRFLPKPTDEYELEDWHWEQLAVWLIWAEAYREASRFDEATRLLERRPDAPEPWPQKFINWYEVIVKGIAAKQTEPVWIERK